MARSPTCNSSCSQSPQDRRLSVQRVIHKKVHLRTISIHPQPSAASFPFSSYATNSFCHHDELFECNFQLVSPWWVVQKCKDAYRGQFAWCSFKWLGKCTAGIFNHNFSTSTLACHSQFCISMTDWHMWPVKFSSQNRSIFFCEGRLSIDFNIQFFTVLGFPWHSYQGMYPHCAIYSLHHSMLWFFVRANKSWNTLWQIFSGDE